MSTQKNLDPFGRYKALDVIFDQELDGRWIAEIPELPGAMAYGKTKQDAAIGLAFRIIAPHVRNRN